jgi:molybdenum cofactor synthesis domain-containing protein
MDVALLTVGDELLDGDTENTNASWLSRQLTERGVSVRRVLTVPDELAVIADATRRYSDRFDAVLVTGGLGRTPDDVTVAGVAQAFDRELVESDLARADVERTLEAIAGDYPELAVDAGEEALLPAESRPLLNHAGISPGCVVESVYVLPGIPSEMERMFESVEAEFAGDVDSRYLYTEEPEANLIERLDDVQRRFDVKVGCYPDREAGHNRLKITADDEAALAAATEWLREEVTLADAE